VLLCRSGLGGDDGCASECAVEGVLTQKQVDRVREDLDHQNAVPDQGYTTNTAGVPIANPTSTTEPTAFGRSGSLGVFTIAPTIKPKGGFFTRPECITSI